MKKIYTYEYCEKFVKDFTTLEELMNVNKSIVTVIRQNGWRIYMEIYLNNISLIKSVL